jgi:hypothetical protein
MNLRHITPKFFWDNIYLNQYLGPMYIPEPFFTSTSVLGLRTTWLYREKRYAKA